MIPFVAVLVLALLGAFLHAFLFRWPLLSHSGRRHLCSRLPVRFFPPPYVLFDLLPFCVVLPRTPISLLGWPLLLFFIEVYSTNYLDILLSLFQASILRGLHCGGLSPRGSACYLVFCHLVL